MKYVYFAMHKYAQNIYLFITFLFRPDILHICNIYDNMMIFQHFRYKYMLFLTVFVSFSS